MIEVIAEAYPRSNRHLISRIRLVNGDLTKQDGVDAIVTSMEKTLKANRSLNRAVMGAAGPELDEFILEHIYRPHIGDVFAVPPFGLPVKHLIIAITPLWRDGIENEDRDLLRCYRGVMKTAHEMGLKKIAFPALGTGAGKFPVVRAARLGIQGIMDRLTPDFEEIRIVCNRPETYDAFQEWLTHYAGGQAS